MSEYVKVATVEEIPPGTMKTFEMGFNRFIVAHTGEVFFALVDECSHDGAPIGDGELKDHEIVCPRHGARFDIRTGEVTAPPALVPVDCLDLKVNGNDILVRLEEN